MKRYGILLLILIILGTGGALFYRFHSSTNALDEAEAQEAIPLVDVRVETHTIQADDTFTSAVEVLGIDYASALAIVDAAADVVDFTNIKAGKDLRLVYEDDVAVRLEYEPGTEYYVAVDLMNDYATTQEDIAYEITHAFAEVTIDESLFLSGVDTGLSEVLLLEYVEVFAWEVDFATQVQSGDSFSVLYEQRSRNGIEAGTGDVLYGTFTSSYGTSTAYRFIDDNDITAYYDEEGQSMQRQFLKAPLNYSRITSGFTYSRFHPVLQASTPHRAIDYAAATGTPIFAVADGVVTQAGWNGGFGNYIDISHGSVYDTQYAHLSRYAVSAGDTVVQGETIGYVGNTGFSTGPHLHYQVQVHGELVNPLEVDFPEGDPILEEERASFEQQRDEIDALR
jgi:murein DD-endopeptidase MepM/ murein hydrolase activator NlpD